MISVTAPGRWLLILVPLVAGACAPAADPPVDHDAPPMDPLLQMALATFGGPLDPPSATALEAPDITLGRALFWDPRLSRDGQTACASCHTREAWGADSRPFSTDARGATTSRHSQTVFNVTLQPTLRWLGDRESAAHQATGSIRGSMGFDDAGAILPALREHGYEDAFRSAFPGDPDPLHPDNYGRALEAYQATLVTPAPFDRWLEGEPDALSPGQRSGLETFLSTGCGACHAGPLLGGGSFHRFGITADYWTATGSEGIDQGRFAMTGQEGDRYVFRVPMLRNIARTAPYFHDGSVSSLHDAVRIMAQLQLGKTLEEPEVEGIVEFLEALTGDVPEHYAPPEAMEASTDHR
jgi:cytochrome c peroxidase